MTDNEFVKDVERRLEERESLGIFVIRELVEIANRQKAELELMRRYIHSNNLEYDLLSYKRRILIDDE